MKPCGPFTVEAHGDRALIVCHGCGDLAPGGSRGTWIDADLIAPFVHRIRGPLARFAVHATAEHRLELADALEQCGAVAPGGEWHRPESTPLDPPRATT